MADEDSDRNNAILAAVAVSESRVISQINGLADRLEAIAASLARVEGKVDFIGQRLLNPSEQKAIGIPGGGGSVPPLPVAAKGR